MSQSTVRYKCPHCTKIILPDIVKTLPESLSVLPEGDRYAQCTYCDEYFVITKKETQSRTGRSSRAKGANFERSVAKKLSKWWGGNYEFKRTPGSGGSALKVGFDMAGDICSNAPDFKFHLELKNSSASWDGLDQILVNPGFILWKWLDQCLLDCPKHRIPLIVFTRVGRSTYCASPQAATTDSILTIHNRIIKSGLKHMSIVTPDHPILYIWSLDEMLDGDPNIWK